MALSTYEGPWNEEQWERFMDRCDIRSAKYGELLETFREDPDCHEIIAREMGWEGDRSLDSSFQVDLPEEDLETEGDEIDPNFLEEEEGGYHELKSLPVYWRSHDFGMAIYKALQPLFVDDEESPDTALVNAVSNAHIIAVKLIGGHSMGYTDDTLCANIVCCKRSLQASELCLAALENLRQRHLLSDKVATSLILEGSAVRELVIERIQELRKRVWWE